VDAIRHLELAAKNWPKDRWIFSADGKLYVMRCGPDGEPVMTDSVGGGVDPDYIETAIHIPSDGGDW